LEIIYRRETMICDQYLALTPTVTLIVQGALSSLLYQIHGN
jgi:hypothetical protein